jgi:antitoxin component YwqK of YwqJK toxin-antitoxin module
MATRAQSLNNFLIAISFLFAGCRSGMNEAVVERRSVRSDDPAFSIKKNIAWYDNKKFSGIVYSLHENNDTAFSLSYSNGIENGLHKKWFSNGVVSEERWYKAGIKQGPQKAWWDNGKPQYVFYAVNDMYEGQYREWTREGILLRDFHYVNGQEEGAQKFFNEDGTIRSNYVIHSGRRYGLLGTKNCVNVKDSVLAD